MSGESSLGKYLKDIGRFPLLTREQEVALARQAADPKRTPREREQARQRLAASNLRLVVSIAKQYARSGVPLADLIAEGNVGLMKAIRGFDPERGTRISTYATFWIRQSIQIAVREYRKGVRLPAHMTGAVARIREKREALRQELQREPTFGELYEALDPETRAILKRHMDSDGFGRVVSLEEVLKLQQTHSTEIEGEAAPRWNEIEEVMERVKELLDARERQILRLRYGLNGEAEGKTLSEIGSILGITRERVRQLEARAIDKLRRGFAMVPA